jgi:CpXC motif protein
MDRQFMISLVRADRGAPFTVDTKFLERAGGVTPKHPLRFVTSYNQLREKILIFEADLNDFAVELLKMLMWEAKFPEKQITDDSMYFCKVDTQTPAAQQLTFECYDAGKRLAHMDVPYSTYAQILTNPKAEKLRAYRLGEWILVNQSNLYQL